MSEGAFAQIPAIPGTLKTMSAATRTTRAALIHARLVAQHLTTPLGEDPHGIVARFGAMQGQDLSSVTSSIALRLHASPWAAQAAGGGAAEGAASAADAYPGDGVHPDPRMARVIDAFNTGNLVRGYPMRGTVFALAGQDARWITELAAKPQDWESPARRARLGLDHSRVDRALDALCAALENAPLGLTRKAVLEVFREAGIDPTGGAGYHLITYFIARGIIVYGPYNGTDNNVVLTRTWLPHAQGIEERFGGDRIAATAELLSRYLTSHGPATLRDFAWWTKLPLRDIRAAHEQIAATLETWGHSESGELYARPGLAHEIEAAGAMVKGTFLLPAFDEIMLGYPDRLALMSADQHEIVSPGNRGVFLKTVLRGGQVTGVWKAPKASGKRRLALEPFGPLPKVAAQQAERAHAAYPHLVH